MITFCLALMSLKPPSHLENSSVCLMPTRRQLCSVSPSVAYPLQFSKRRGYVSNSERGPGADLPTIGRSGDSSRLRPGGDSEGLCRRENLFGVDGNLDLRAEASGVARSCFALNASCFLTGSADTPMAAPPALTKSGLRREKSLASMVQPEVSALG